MFYLQRSMSYSQLHAVYVEPVVVCLACIVWVHGDRMPERLDLDLKE